MVSEVVGKASLPNPSNEEQGHGEEGAQHPLQGMLDEIENLLLHSFRNILAPKTAEVAGSLTAVQEALNIKTDELEAEHQRTTAELQEAIRTVSEFHARISQELASVQIA